MAIVSFNLEKMNVEKTAPAQGKSIDVKNNVVIKNIEKKELALGDAKKDGLKFIFEFEAKYTPEIGNINISGNILYLASQKKAKEILKFWDKEKKLTTDIAPEIINTILMKCSVKSLNLAHDVNLPPNISLPALKLKSSKDDVSKYIG